MPNEDERNGFRGSTMTNGPLKGPWGTAKAAYRRVKNNRKQSE